MERVWIVVLASTALGGCFWEFGKDRYRFVDDGGVDGARVVDGSIDGGCTMTCGGECRNTTNDPMHCGSCDRSCAAPDNGRPTCINSVCSFACEPGYVRVGTDCLGQPSPRPIGPASTSTVTSHRPTLQWELGARSDGARVQLCSDRACTRVLQTIDAPGDRVRPPTDLAPGVVFWRLFARLNGETGTLASPTWQFYVGHRNAPNDTYSGTALDLNGDGAVDLAIAADEPRSDGSGATRGVVYIYLASEAGFSSDSAQNAPSMTLVGPDAALDGSFGAQVSSIGDFNGDGFGDLAIGTRDVVDASPAGSRSGRIYVYFGGPDGLRGTGGQPHLRYENPAGAPVPWGVQTVSGGDYNGDGYSDLFLAKELQVECYAGGPEGSVSTSARLTFTPPADRDPPAPAPRGDGIPPRRVLLTGALGDINGDRRCDSALAYERSDGFVRLYVYFGQPDFSLGTPTALLLGSAIRAIGDVQTGIVALETAAGGDVSGDGYDELIVSMVDSAVFGFRKRTYVLLGAEGTIGGAVEPIQAIGEPCIPCVERAGDVNADGYVDVALLSYGQARIRFGSPSGLSAADPVVLQTNTPAPPGVFAGADVNRDSGSDVFVGQCDDAGLCSVLGRRGGPDLSDRVAAAAPDYVFAAPTPATQGFGRSPIPRR